MLFLLTSAFAQVAGGDVPELNAQLFRPSIGSKSTLWTDQSLLAPSGTTTGRAVLHYVNQPLVYKPYGGESTALISGLWQLNVMAAHTRGPLRLGVDLPLYLRSNGVQGGETGLGNIGLEGRFTALDRTEGPIGLAALVRLGLPTTTVSAPLGGGFNWELGLVADTELTDSTTLAVNVGTRGVREVKLENLEWDDQAFLRAGIGQGIGDSAGVSLDLPTHFTYGEFGNPAARPAELLVGGWQQVGDNLVVRAGVGSGLNSAVGSSRYRVVLGLGYEPGVEDPDSDNDGLRDSVDSCPQVPEDLDGYLDDDGCPEATPVRVVLVDHKGNAVEGATWQLGDNSGATGVLLDLEAGDYTVTASHEDYLPASLEAAIPDGPEYTLSVPMALIPGTLLVKATDNEGNVVADATWRAHDTDIKDVPAGEPYELGNGTYTIVVTASGYKPIKRTVEVKKESEALVELEMEPSKAKVTKERIEIEEKVFFEVNQDVIKAESFDLLNDVAAILVANPELTKVSIEGHTDSDGNDDDNMDLSQRRAQSVVNYLVSKGVEAERLVAVGYGETKPLVANDSEKNKAKNRRVEIRIVERAEESTTPSTKK